MEEAEPIETGRPARWLQSDWRVAAGIALLLAAAPGATLVLRVEGEDEADALAACAALFERRFDEDD